MVVYKYCGNFIKNDFIHSSFLIHLVIDYVEYLQTLIELYFFMDQLFNMISLKIFREKN